MILKAAKASKFKPLDEGLKEALLLSGAVPVNDIFFPIFNNNNKINLFFGSYGSGKSVTISDILIKDCINNPYFRCYFGRKVLETVRGTVHKTIIDRIKDLKKAHLFDFSEKPNGSMNIVHKETGNEFIPFGATDAQSLKSIKDPTHFFVRNWINLLLKISVLFIPGLRTEKATTQLYAAFNTERIYQSHWIRKVLFEGEFQDQSFKLKANYYDNYFIDHEDYYNKLKLIANGNAAVLNSIAHGEWGVVRTGGEFWKQFDETKHVGKVEYKTGVVWVSLDENVNPYVTITVWQIEGKLIKQVKEILCKTPDNNAPKAAVKLADWLESIGHKDMVFVCGDPSASRHSTVDANSSSFYIKFIEVLQQRKFYVTNKVMKSPPEVALSGAFINAIYENSLYGWSILIGDENYTSIEDYLLVKEDAEGKMMKEKVTDSETGIRYEPRGHIGDAKRYFILTILAKDFITYKGRRAQRNVAGFFH